ncbi:MAG: TrkH family potassium uptake protein [Deltaproteobacteria bacterium]|nr:TrkH family potassium uptake protein [Deltaproteobacteria bacterium]
MRLSSAFHIAGVVNTSLGLAMLIPAFVSLVYKEGDALALFSSSAITVTAGILLFFIFKKEKMNIGHREGFFVVAVTWLSAGFFSSLPFILSGVFPSITDCLFEGVSGITTTGASILSSIENLPHGILLWRSMTHWIGGMGIVLLSLAVLPLLGIGGMQLYKAEASTISGDKFVPRMQDMAKILFTVYIVFTLVMFTLLMVSGVNFYDSIIHTLGGISTAGFSNKDLSAGGLGNIYAEIIIIVFMILGATNFALHYGFLKKGFRSYTKSEEFRFYIAVIIIATVLITINLKSSFYSSWGDSLRYASFQATSITTTTGYTTTDYGLWPFFSQLVLLSLMFIGGSVGSTTGSLKCVRILLMIKQAYKEIYRLIHPHAIIPVKLNGKVVSDDIMKSVTGFAFLFFLVFIVSSVLLSLTGLDLITSISSAAATLGNVGPALGIAGPGASYALVPDSAKWILMANMFMGRLEIYTLLILLVPAFWRG